MSATTKITFADMRAAGVSGVLVYCSDYRCSHWIKLSASRWADEVRLSDIEPRFTCEACGRRGADVRPDWQTAVRLALERPRSHHPLRVSYHRLCGGRHACLCVPCCAGDGDRVIARTPEVIAGVREKAR